MINRLNLASKPFRNRTGPWLLSACILVISLFFFIFLYVQWGSVKTEAEQVKSSSLEIESELKAYQEKEQQVKQQLTPQQQQLLLAAHRLVILKQFSWSRLFSDVENVLPGGVSVSSIVVENVALKNGRTEAELQFGVLSRDYRNVMGMIDNMNSSGLFRAEMRGQDRQKSDSGDYTEYSLHLTYTPHYNVSVQPDGPQSAENSIPEVQQ